MRYIIETDYPWTDADLVKKVIESNVDNVPVCVEFSYTHSILSKIISPAQSTPDRPFPVLFRLEDSYATTNPLFAVFEEMIDEGRADMYALFTARRVISTWHERLLRVAQQSRILTMVYRFDHSIDIKRPRHIKWSTANKLVDGVQKIAQTFKKTAGPGVQIQPVEEDQD